MLGLKGKKKDLDNLILKRGWGMRKNRKTGEDNSMTEECRGTEPGIWGCGCVIEVWAMSLHVVYMFACSRLFSLSLSIVSPTVISPTNRNQGRNFTKNISNSVHMIWFFPKLYFFLNFWRILRLQVIGEIDWISTWYSSQIPF